MSRGARSILTIVEGHGDAVAVPTLIRRVAQAHGIYDLTTLRPHIRGDLPKIRPRLKDYLLAAAEEDAPVFWVLDYDCDTCTDVLRDIAGLQAEAKQATPHLQVRFAFMVKEFESLFLTDEATTRQVLKSIPSDLRFPTEPESVRGAKEWLSKALPKGQAYKETIHQDRIASQLNLDVLRRNSPSFIRFERSLLDLIQ